MTSDDLCRKTLKMEWLASETPSVLSNNDVNHHSPLFMIDDQTTLLHNDSHIVLPEPPVTRFSKSHSHVLSHDVIQKNPGSPDGVVAPALTLPSFRELVQEIGSSAQCAPQSENKIQSDIRPLLLAGPQSFDQESLNNKSSSRRFTIEQSTAANSPGSSNPIALFQNDTGSRVSCYRPQLTEEFRVARIRSPDEGKFTTHDSPINWYSVPSAPKVHRKRTRTTDSSDVSPQPLGRRRWAEVYPSSDISREAVISGGTSYAPSSPPQLKPSTRTSPTVVEVQTSRPKEEIYDIRQTSGGEFFKNASNIVVKDSNMIAIGSMQHLCMRNEHSDETALRWLKEHTMRGAEHDSADRDPPPRCHPGTRTTIVQKAHVWLRNSKREKNLLWLRGFAGVGKSAIIQTLAESLSEAGRLGASLFFSRPNGRANPRQILPTLAYRFAVQDSSYREYITQLMRADPESLEKAMNEQFRILIVEPFVRKGIRSGTEAWVVALDGLDECAGDPNGRRHSNDAQCDVVRLISDFVRHNPTAPLVWIIASRPETHLKAVFSEPDVISVFWEEEVPVDSDEACEDVEKFLHKEFTKIGQKYPDHIRGSPWPTNTQFLKIARAALGLFIFAEVVIRFIDDPDVGNPIAQLECVLLAISKMQSKKDRENPLVDLDAIYIAILSKIPPGTLPITRRLLGFLMFLTTTNYNVSDCNFHLICKILDVAEDVAITALRHLHSVLYFPRSKSIGDTRPRFYHASFRDLLEDKSRSHEYFIDKRSVMAESIQRISQIAQDQFSSVDDPISSLQPLHSKYHEGKPNHFISIFLERVFYGVFSLGGVHLKSGRNGWITGSLPDAQLQQLLESLNAIKVIKYVPGAFYSYYWCSEKRDDRELSRRGFLSWTTVGSLGINWDAVSVSTSNLTGFHHVHVDETAGIQTELRPDNPKVQEIRRIFKAAAPETEAKIWGHKKSNCHVIVVTLRLEQYAITGVPLVVSPHPELDN